MSACKCAICEDIIVEESQDLSGQDAIFCEGSCQAWLHRGCAGLSKSAFLSLNGSSVPFACVHCRLNQQEKEISQLKNLVSKITADLTALSTSPPQMATGGAQSAGRTVASPGGSVNESLPRDVGAAQARKLTSPETIDRKSNVIVYGVNECAPGTSFLDRSNLDMASIKEIITPLDSNLSDHSIRDCRRLGKFTKDLTRPRPILVTLNRRADVLNILDKAGSLAHPLSIKQDRSREDRVRDAILLKERWRLMGTGTDKKKIKIRNSKIFVSGVLHGEVVDSTFNLSDGSQHASPLSTNVNQVSDEVSDNNETLSQSVAADDKMTRQWYTT